ncbi:MAG TPA: hypothetical protein VHO24_17180 [Opitutaceae bacterium]|nr:hypothetical protein [Opitutaceae bacterium]
MKIRLRNLPAFLLLGFSATGFAQTIASFTPAAPFLSALPSATTISGQTFTAAFSGTVGVVTVLAQATGPSPSSITVQLRSVSGGLPTAAILGVVSTPGVGLTGSLSAFSVDFSSQAIAVNAGDSYALTLFGTALFGLGGGTNGYAGGAQVNSTGGAPFVFFAPARDLSFSVMAAPSLVAVPEPSTYGAAAVVSLVGICAWSRKRKRKS